MAEISQNARMTVGGKSVESGQYGGDYASEYRRILSQYIPFGARRFLEWGSGYTTGMMVDALGDRDVDLFLTIDSNKKYQDDVIAPIQRPYLKGVVASMTGTCVDDRDPGFNYSHTPLELGGNFDFIFIDGRRRVECAYVAALVASENSVVVVHDYRRDRYQSILALFDVIEDGPQFRVLKVNPVLGSYFRSILPSIVSRFNKNKNI